MAETEEDVEADSPQEAEDSVIEEVPVEEVEIEEEKIWNLI